MSTSVSSDQALPDSLAPALRDLSARVNTARFPLAATGADEGIALQRTLRAQLADYVIPRVADSGAPLLVVVGGSTGAGKSTLVNSMLGTAVSKASAVRPTTATPVLIHHPDDADYFTGNRILPGLKRFVRDGATQGQPSLRLVSSARAPRGIALVDSPDIDSVAGANRELAAELLAAADLWVFVTTAARYADAAPWEVLRGASARGTAVAVVLDRVPAEANHEVRHHLGRLLSESGLGQAPIFTLPEVRIPASGFLPDAAVHPIRSWLFNVAAGPRVRSRVASRTLHGALETVGARVRTLADYAGAQETAHAALSRTVDESFADAQTSLRQELYNGAAVRGDVLARWQDFIGSGQFFKGLEPSAARLRDRITARALGKREAAGPLIEALEDALGHVIRKGSVDAVTRVALSWQEEAAGAALLAKNKHIAAVPSDFADDTDEFMSGFVSRVTELVSQTSNSRKTKAKILSFGVQAVSAVLLVAVCSGVGQEGNKGRQGDRVVANTAEVAGRLLDTIFGSEVMAELLSTVRKDVESGTDGLLLDCRKPFEQALTVAEVPSKQARGLTDSAARLEELL